MMNDLMNTLEDLNETIENAVINSSLAVTAGQLGLDPRSYYGTMYASADGIAVEGAVRSLNYYGGFESVDAANVKTYGDWTIYTCECERVREHLYRVLSPKDVEALQLQYEYGDRPEEDED